MLKKFLKVHLPIFSIGAIYVFLLTYFKIHCPIKYFLGITCPTCGVTRAMLSLMRGDFAGYMHYNPLAIFLLLSVLLLIHRNLFKDKVKTVITVVSLVILSVNAVYCIALNIL